jgi:hypothetical protein
VSDLSPQARALLRAARPFDEPTDADARRVRASVLTKVAAGFGAAAGLTASTTYASGAGALFAAATGKIGAAVLVLAGVAGTYAAVQLRSPPPERPRSVIVETEAPKSIPTAHPVVTNGTVMAEEATPRARIETKGRAQAPLASGHRKRATADLEGEASLLEDADAALRAGNPNLALARLADHAAKYPAGALSDEREGIRAIALCRAGRLVDGRAAADRILSATRKTSLAARVRTACTVEKPGE